MTRAFDWSAPAKLFHWPAIDGSEDGDVYATLWDALHAAGEGDLGSAWIVTQNGDILSPRLVASLREEPLPRPRRREAVGRSLFAWKRAA